MRTNQFGNPLILVGKRLLVQLALLGQFANGYLYRVRDILGRFAKMYASFSKFPSVYASFESRGA